MLLHVPLATFGSMAVSLVVITPASWLLRMAGLDLSYIGRLGPYTPAFWAMALLLGLLTNRYMENRFAGWVWAVGLVFLFVVMAWDVSILKHSGRSHYWRYELDQLFSINSGKCGDSECLEELLVTTPVLNSIAYSVGAWLAFRSRPTNTD
jgi:hypothetical protein